MPPSEPFGSKKQSAGDALGGRSGEMGKARSLAYDLALNLAMVGVASSSLVSRSTKPGKKFRGFFALGRFFLACESLAGRQAIWSAGSSEDALHPRLFSGAGVCDPA
jgi:hypothetical protein